MGEIEKSLDPRKILEIHFATIFIRKDIIRLIVINLREGDKIMIQMSILVKRFSTNQCC